MAPRTRTIKNKDGSVTTKRADGTETTKYKSGSVAEKDAEGTITTTARDGSYVVEYPGGDLQSYDTHGELTTWIGSDKSVASKLDDGSWKIDYDDGSVKTIKDGITRTIELDGTETISRDSDHTETVITADGLSTTLYPDQHTVVVNAAGDSTTEYPNGRKVFVDGKTGTSIEINPDGSTRQSNPDGSVSSRSKDGVETFEKDGGKTVRPNSGYEETTLPTGEEIRVFPGGIELHTMPDGSTKWETTSADASLGEGSVELDGFVSAPRAEALSDPFGEVDSTGGDPQVARYIDPDELPPDIPDILQPDPAHVGQDDPPPDPFPMHDLDDPWYENGELRPGVVLPGAGDEAPGSGDGEFADVLERLREEPTYADEQLAINDGPPIVTEELSAYEEAPAFVSDEASFTTDEQMT